MSWTWIFIFIIGMVIGVILALWLSGAFNAQTAAADNEFPNDGQEPAEPGNAPVSTAKPLPRSAPPPPAMAGPTHGGEAAAAGRGAPARSTATPPAAAAGASPKLREATMTPARRPAPPPAAAAGSSTNNSTAPSPQIKRTSAPPPAQAAWSEPPKGADKDRR